MNQSVQVSLILFKIICVLFSVLVAPACRSTGNSGAMDHDSVDKESLGNVSCLQKYFHDASRRWRFSFRFIDGSSTVELIQRLGADASTTRTLPYTVELIYSIPIMRSYSVSGVGPGEFLRLDLLDGSTDGFAVWTLPNFATSAFDCTR